MKFGNPVITDTLNWIKISGIYAANGGEDHIIIGNFYDDARTLQPRKHEIRRLTLPLQKTKLIRRL